MLRAANDVNEIVNAVNSDHNSREQTIRSVARSSSSRAHDGRKSMYSDSALKAWSTLIGAVLLQTYVAGVITSFGVFQAYYTEVFLSSYSTSTISWIGGAQYFLELGCAPISGRLYDAGFFRLTVGAGSFLSCFCFFMLSLTKPNQYWQVFLVQGIGMGIAGGLVYLPTVTVVSKHFMRHRALAMGLVTASCPTGAIVFSIMLNRLVNSPLGFDWGLRAAGFLAFGLFILGNLLIFEPSSSPQITETSSSIELQATIPYVGGEASESAATSAPTSTSDLRPSGPPSSASSTRPLSRPLSKVGKTIDLPFAIMLVAAFFVNMGITAPYVYIQLFASQRGVDSNLAFYSLPILNAGSVIGRIAPLHFADHVGAFNLYIGFCAIAGAFQFVFLGTATPAVLVVFCLFYGIFSGAVIALYLPTITEMTASAAGIGKRMGLALGPIGIAATIGPPITGAIVGSSYNWLSGIIFSAVVVIAPLPLNVIARTLSRQQLRRLQIHVE